MARRIIFISHNKPFAWAIKRVLLNVRIINGVRIVGKKEFLQIKPSEQDIVIFDTNNKDRECKQMWEMRIRGSRAPFICLGLNSEEHFLEDARNLVFDKRPYQYRYISNPFLLTKFIKALNGIEPVHEADLNSDIKKYSNIKGLIGRHLHDVKNAISNGDSKKLINALDKIRKLLTYLQIDNKIQNELCKRIDELKKQMDFKLAKFLSDDLYGLIEGR